MTLLSSQLRIWHGRCIGIMCDRNWKLWTYCGIKAYVLHTACDEHLWKGCPYFK